MKKAISIILTVFIVTGIILKDEHNKQNVQVSFIARENIVMGANDEKRETGNPVGSVEKAVTTSKNKEVNISSLDRKSETIQMAREIADQHGLDQEMLLCVLNDESGVESHNPKTGEVKCGDNGASCGIGQIKIGTWKLIRRQAGWSQEDNRANDYENIQTTAYGIMNGFASHWTGYRNCVKRGYKI